MGLGAKARARRLRAVRVTALLEAPTLSPDGQRLLAVLLRGMVAEAGGKPRPVFAHYAAAVERGDAAEELKIRAVLARQWVKFKRELEGRPRGG
jgi:hypothetical protein